LIQPTQIRDNIFNWKNKMTRKKKYSKEFKLDAVNLVLEKNYTKVAATRSLEVNPNLLGR
jgi:transposase